MVACSGSVFLLANVSVCATVGAGSMTLLPPLRPPALVPPAPRFTPLPLPPLQPPAGHVITSRPGKQSMRQIGAALPALQLPLITPPGTGAYPLPPPRTTTSSGNDWVQVTLDKPDDAYARVEFIAAGVDLHPGSLVPRNGAMHIITATSGACVYRWRC